MKINLYTKKLKAFLVREATALGIIIVLSYFFELVFIFYRKDPAPSGRPFWNDPYFYQFWKNSWRENGQIIRFLGYPLLAALRLTGWTATALEHSWIRRKNMWQERVLSAENKGAKIKEALDGIVAELKLDSEIEEISYNLKHQWYIIRFNKPPNIIIPYGHIEEYLKSEGKSGRQELADFFAPRPRKA